jgi:uncharacterized protein YjiS (DUF1127 family)
MARHTECTHRLVCVKSDAARQSRILRARELRSWLRGLTALVAGYWRRRAVEAELYSLDNRGLRDIGIGRGDIPAIADGAYFQDDSRRQRGAQIRAASDNQEYRSSKFVDLHQQTREK